MPLDLYPVGWEPVPAFDDVVIAGKQVNTVPLRPVAGPDDLDASCRMTIFPWPTMHLFQLRVYLP